MRVGLVVPRFAPYRGGVETYTEQAAGALSGRGVDVTVVTQVPRASGLTGRVVRDGYVVERHPLPVGSSFDVPSPTAVRSATESGRFDVLWAHSYHTMLAWLVAERARPPLVLTPHYHGTGHTRLRAALHRPYRLAGRRLLAASRRIIVDTVAEASLLQRDFPREIRDDALDVVPLAVPNPVRGQPRRHPVPLILTVARQEPYKRTDLLVEAIAGLRREGVPVRLAVVGDGPALADLRTLAEYRGVADAVTFTGLVDDEALGDWWASASVYASASEQEAFGIAAAQALVAGLPVALSAIPAHRELVDRAGRAARAELVGADSTGPGGYAAAIRHLLADGCPRSDRAAACTLPTPETMADQLLAVLMTAAA